MSFWEWLGVYGVIAGLFIFIGWVLQYGDWKMRRDGARIIFLCPVWPAILAYGIFIGVRQLWRLAEFDQVKK